MNIKIEGTVTINTEETTNAESVANPATTEAGNSVDKVSATPVKVGTNSSMGYDEIDGVLVPNEKAEIIRFIFESYASGTSIEKIIDELEKRGVKSPRGKDRFNTASIWYILHNEVYVGDRLIQKQPPKDFYTKKPDPTKEYESFYITDDHEPIISREIWEQVRERGKLASAHKTYGSFFLKGRVFCGECGAKMRRISYTKNGKRQKVWKCAERLKFSKGNGCLGDVITEVELAEILCDHLGIEFSGVENLKEEDFAQLKAIRVYNDGRIEIE